jgi:hypothetical protein
LNGARQINQPEVRFATGTENSLICHPHSAAMSQFDMTDGDWGYTRSSAAGDEALND